MTKKKSQIDKLIHRANVQLSKIKRSREKHERREISNTMESEFQLRCLFLRRSGSFRRPLYWDHNDGDDAPDYDVEEAEFYEDETVSTDKEMDGWDKMVRNFTKLTETEMEVIRDRFEHLLTIKEIAKKNGIGLSGVYRIIDNAKDKLAEGV